MIRLVFIAIALSPWLTGCATTAANDWTRFSDGSLAEWLEEEVIPGLGKTFTEHPRFRNETIRVAALDAEQVAERSNGLTTAVRNAVHSALLEHPGLNVVRADGPATCPVEPVDGYFVAVESSPSGSRGGIVQLRLFDTVERQWVSGFNYQWRGELSRQQRDALGRTVVAESARGLRALPFTGDQSDLLAQRLAADLACQLRHRGDDELIVQPARDRAAALIAGNLAAKHRIPVANEGELELETRVHKVGDKLYQVWALLTPADAPDDVSALATSAYATKPLLKPKPAQHTTPPKPVVVPAVAAPAPRPEIELLSRLQVIAATGTNACSSRSWQLSSHALGRRPVIAPDSCFGLKFDRDPRAQLYIFSHQVDAGLQRLYPARCAGNAAATSASVVRFPEHRQPLRWDDRAGTETLYVIAARGSRAAARLDQLIGQLPDGCKRDNDTTPASPDWLAQIDQVVRAGSDDVAWQAVRVYHQPRNNKTRLGEIRGARR